MQIKREKVRERERDREKKGVRLIYIEREGERDKPSLRID